jgi:deoxyribonuclease-2
MDLSAMDNDGKPVDWWFMYKISGKATTKDKEKISGLTGAEYIYFDSAEINNGKLYEPVGDDVLKRGALPNTINQLYTQPGPATEHLGWFFYNDEDPLTGKTNGTLGHTKGVLAYDFGSDTAFWLVQSTPKFPESKIEYEFPETGLPNAQTLLCITLKNADVSRSIANQMYSAQQPNVFLSSPLPADLVHLPNDPRVQLMEGKVVEGNSPFAATLPLLSKADMKFTSIAKNRYWGLDFYNDLVGPTLHDNLDVETWTHGTTPPSLQSDKVHTVVDMTGIDLTPLGYNIIWPETDDHAKLAISAASEATHFICVGDINFTLSMRKRSGGTVAFQCDPLWQGISDILTGVTTHLKTGSKAATQQVKLATPEEMPADPAVKVTMAAYSSGSLRPDGAKVNPRKKTAARPVPRKTVKRKAAAKRKASSKSATRRSASAAVKKKSKR